MGSVLTDRECHDSVCSWVLTTHGRSVFDWQTCIVLDQAAFCFLANFPISLVRAKPQQVIDRDFSLLGTYSFWGFTDIIVRRHVIVIGLDIYLICPFAVWNLGVLVKL